MWFLIDESDTRKLLFRIPILGRIYTKLLFRLKKNIKYIANKLKILLYHVLGLFPEDKIERILRIYERDEIVNKAFPDILCIEYQENVKRFYEDYKKVKSERRITLDNQTYDMISEWFHDKLSLKEISDNHSLITSNYLLIKYLSSDSFEKKTDLYKLYCMNIGVKPIESSRYSSSTKYQEIIKGYDSKKFKPKAEVIEEMILLFTPYLSMNRKKETVNWISFLKGELVKVKK